MAEETAMKSTTSVNNIETQSSNQSSPLRQKKTAGKKSVTDDTRGLSAFFMLGIAINIIMAVTFTWWFTREWRRSK